MPRRTETATLDVEPAQAQAPADGPFIDAPPEDVPVAFAPKSNRADRRGSVSVKLDPDGKPDFAGLKEKQLEKWKELCESEEFKLKFGLEKRSFEVDPKLVEGLIDMLGRVQATVFAIKFKLPYDVALRVASYNEQEREALMPPSKRVIEKHAPALAAKYGDELVLFGLLTNMTMVKLSIAKQVAAELEKSKAIKPNGEAKEEAPKETFAGQSV